MGSPSSPVGESPATQTRPAPGPVQRTVDLLILLAESDDEVNVRDVVKLLGVPSSTAHRLLRQLVDAGFASYDADSRSYGIGPLFHRAAALVNARSSIATTVQPFLDELTATCGETSLLAVFHPADSTVFFAAKADSEQALSYRIDLNVPVSAYWGSSSQVIAAYLPEADLRRVMDKAGPSPVDNLPPVPEEQYRALLASIRKRGFLVTKGQKLPGAVGTAAPVFDVSGIVGSLTVTIPEVRYRQFKRGDLQRLVVQTSAEISRALGYSG